ncbi:MAG: caspase family protein [Treponema sp.]|nr:caspase family protein [Treponema sp.]
MKKVSIFIVFALVLLAVTANLSFAAGIREQKKGDLWVLAVGIDQYSDNQAFPNLAYAVSDAVNITALFKAQEGKAFERVNTLLVADTGIAPTRNNILSSLAFFSNARPNDTVILYFALHSILDAEGNYYLIPSDYTTSNVDDLFYEESLINFNDILQSFDIPGNIIIILDTHFGETAVNMASGRNIAILGACKDNEHAYESVMTQGGFLTVSIIEAFTGENSINGDITLVSLFNFLTERVSQISQNRQTPVLLVPSAMQNLVIGVAD